MWDQATDRRFLELRADAVLLFTKSDLRLICMNAAAKKLFPSACEGTAYAELFQDHTMETLVQDALGSDQPAVAALVNPPWFSEPAMMHAVSMQWDSLPAVAVTIGRRAHGSPPQSLQIIKAVLTSAYFTAVRINLRSSAATVISDPNVLMNTQAKFDAFSDYIRLYAESAVDAADRQVFLSAFSETQIRRFLDTKENTECTVRLIGDEKRWASYSLTAVNASAVLLLGKDNSEQHREQERTDRYRAELQSLSQRNSYILSCVSDIFRLMLHIDLKTGETVFCSMDPSLLSLFSYDKVYSFEEVATMLLGLVHPEDRPRLVVYSDLRQYMKPSTDSENRVSIEYRRIHPGSVTEDIPKWTRSVLTFLYDEQDMPTEAFYAVQDIDAQRRKEIAAQRAQDSVTAQFYTLIQNRFLWFVECDFGTETARCIRIKNQTVLPAIACPFGQFFERLIMPHCHPEDYKLVAKTLLPIAAAEAYKKGKRQVTIEYRHKSENGWKYARAEMYLRTDDLGDLHTMIYVSDIDKEVQSRDQNAKTEHAQLLLHRKFGLMVRDDFVQIAEIDLDADTISYYQKSGSDFVLVNDPVPVSRHSELYPERYIHPRHRQLFSEMFSYQHILQAAREHTEQIKHLFLFDIHGDQNYSWCNVAAQFFRDENGKSYLMAYVENVNDEVCRRDGQLHALAEAKQKMQEQIRAKERGRIRKAHMLLNITSNFQLALNRIYASLDRLEHTLPAEEAHREDFRSMFTAYEHLSAMTECAKDILLLENNQLQLIKEPTNLPMLLRRMQQSAAGVLEEKQLKILIYTSHVMHETVLCDAGRLSFIIDNLFINMIRSLPFGSAVTVRLAQTDDPIDSQTAVCELSLITYGDRVSQDIQSSICSPIPLHDPLKAIGDTRLLRSANHQQHNLYLAKRLLSLMGGTLEFVKLPDHAGAMVLRLPFPYVKQQIIFPHRFCFGKRAFVWDSQQQSAMATMEILRETGMQIQWQADFDNLCANLQLGKAQHAPCDFLLIRQSDLNAETRNCLEEITAISPNTEILVLTEMDAALPDGQENSRIRYAKIPLFRSVLAEHLHAIAQKYEKY